MLKSRIYKAIVSSAFVVLALICVGLFIGCATEPIIILYLNDNITDEQKENIEQEIRSCEEVEEVIYISAEEAYERLDEKYKEDIESKSKGLAPVPASYEIILKNSDYIDTVADRFKKEDGNYIDGVFDILYGNRFKAPFRDYF